MKISKSTVRVWGVYGGVCAGLAATVFFFGLSLLSLILSSTLVIIAIAVSLKEAALRIQIRWNPLMKGASRAELQDWVQRRYFVMKVFLAVSLLGSCALIVLGVLTLCPALRRPVRTLIDMLTIGFSIIIAVAGGYLLVLMGRKLRFIVGRKEAILTRIVDLLAQGKNPPS